MQVFLSLKFKGKVNLNQDCSLLNPFFFIERGRGHFSSLNSSTEGQNIEMNTRRTDIIRRLTLPGQQLSSSKYSRSYHEHPLK